MSLALRTIVRGVHGPFERIDCCSRGIDWWSGLINLVDGGDQERRSLIINKPCVNRRFRIRVIWSRPAPPDQALRRF